MHRQLEKATNINLTPYYILHLHLPFEQRHGLLSDLGIFVGRWGVIRISLILNTLRILYKQKLGGGGFKTPKQVELKSSPESYFPKSFVL